MKSDDIAVGRVLGRREVVALLGLSTLTLASGRAFAQTPTRQAPACVVRPAQTEGPYYVDARLDRSDIRSDPATGERRPGIVLDLTFNVSRLSGSACAPLGGAVVDVWHCDAHGAYSDVRDAGGSTVGQKFLRGYQATSSDGVARFTTIYPGWYTGRAVHIHFKIRPDAGREFTSQIYFDESVNDRVFAQTPYLAGGRGRMRNEGDGLYRHGGRQLTVSPVPNGPGYAASFDVALSL